MNSPHIKQKGSMHLFVLMALMMFCMVCACEKSSSSKVEERFPWEMVRECLDQAPEEAQTRLLARFPGSERESGSFARYHIVGSEILEEVTMFQDVRSGRVNTVIVKYRADLGAKDRAQALRELGAPEITNALDHQEIKEVVQGPLMLRARRQDRFGRLTVTVEAAPDPSSKP